MEPSFAALYAVIKHYRGALWPSAVLSRTGVANRASDSGVHCMLSAGHLAVTHTHNTPHTGALQLRSSTPETLPGEEME